MAWYYGKYSCGCEGRTQVYGPTKDRQRIADYRFEGLCPDCWKKQQEEKRAKENAEAAEKSAEMELPELTGSEKQVAWATTIRLQKLEKIFNDADRQIKAIQESQNHIDKKSVAITMIKNALMHFINDKDRTTAWWWIDEKDSVFRYNTILKNYSETSEGAVLLAVINDTATADEIAAADRMAAVRAAKRELGMADTTTDTTTKTDKKIYNKSIIMKRAWELNKQAAGTAVTFSDCLKTSWLQAKVEAGVITMEDAKKTMMEQGLFHKGAKKEEATTETKKEEIKKEETAKTEKDILIEKLETIVATKNSYNNGYHYEIILTEWAKYSKDRTYLKMEETRDYSKHDKITDYGYYDNADKKYVPAKYADINSDFAKI